MDKSNVVEMLNVAECARRLGLPRSTTYKILAREPGVHRMFLPGSKKPIIRAESQVVERILRRSTTPA